jgi:hypothetical protein
MRFQAVGQLDSKLEQPHLDAGDSDPCVELDVHRRGVALQVVYLKGKL